MEYQYFSVVNSIMTKLGRQEKNTHVKNQCKQRFQCYMAEMWRNGRGDSVTDGPVRQGQSQRQGRFLLN